MKKGIIFCRSVSNNKDKALESLEKQEKECINLCKINGIEVSVTYKEVYNPYVKKIDNFFNEAIDDFKCSYNDIDYFILHYIGSGVRKEHCVFSNMSKLKSKNLNNERYYCILYPNRKNYTSILPIEDAIESYYNKGTGCYNQYLEENKYNTITYPKSTIPSPIIGVSEFGF